MIIKGLVTDYDNEGMPSFNFMTNCYWVEVHDKEGTVVFSRKPAGNGSENWLDEKHKQITEALHALEVALLAAIH